MNEWSFLWKWCQIELVWVRVRVEWECFWVNLREDNKVSESKMAVSESNMAEFKMAVIIKLSQNEWVKLFCGNGGNQSWQVWVSLRGNTKMAESNMAKFKMAEFKLTAIIKFRWEWMSLSQIELVWVRVRVEWECFWVNLREDNKVSESKMAVSKSKWQNSKWLSSSSWVRMNEWNFFVEMVGTNLGKCEWVWEEILRWLNPTWPNSRWQNSRWLSSSS